MANVVGKELVTRYMIAFEVAGLLLTAALVGAIAVAHREEIEPQAGATARRSTGSGCRQPVEQWAGSGGHTGGRTAGRDGGVDLILDAGGRRRVIGFDFG